MGQFRKKGNNSRPEESSNPQSFEKDNSNKDTNHVEGSSKPEQSNKNTPRLQSNKNTPRLLNAKSKIVKKSMGDKFKRRLRKNKKVVGNSDELPKEKSEKDGRDNEKGNQNRSTNDKSSIEKSYQAEIIKVVNSEQKQRNKEKHTTLEKGSGSRINKTKHSGVENMDSREQRQEKLSGFIFMCSAKTKPDCFHYRIMGVSISKKDIVLSIKPGTKLFLYDFDLKLLHGIYKASSSGGMKLEPRAFGGNFPVQVRFNVASDCYPLPESIFKKAIKENYDEKHKFKTELTARQVRKLTELFRPVDVRSGLQPVRSPSKVMLHNRDASNGIRGSWSHLNRERDPQIERREEIPHDLFLTEKSYRAYGLQGDRRNVIPTSRVNPRLDPYERDYEREHIHHVDPLYRTNIHPSHKESLHVDPRYLNESEHQTHLRGGISNHADDPYHPFHYGVSPRDPYLPPMSREEISSSSYLVGGRSFNGSDNIQRREVVHDRLYSTYSAADALSEYNRRQHYQESLEATTVPVSSRYSFTGPSYSLR